MTSSKEYWQKREAENLKKNLKTEEEYSKAINDCYEYMLDNIQKEINGFYTKYAKKEGITLAEARKRVSKLDIEAYERKAAKYVKEKNFSDQANEEMRLYNLTMKVNRLEMLKANIGLELVDGFDGLQKYFDQILTERTLQEFERMAGILGGTVRNNAKYAHAIVNASFANATYSDRIWMYQDMLKSELSKLLMEGMIQGKNPRQLAVHLRKRFGVSEYNAERLMRTELARVQIEAQKQSLEKNEFEDYQFICNGTACGICKELNGKHFKIKDMEIAVNAPPMHPNCRCSIAAWMDSEEYEEWLDYLDNGGTAEGWERLKKISANGTIKSKNKTTYSGIPKTWKMLAFADSVLKNINPGYSSGDLKYRTNCTNCVSAYEMRQRGYDVVARASTGNHYLERNPESAWISPKVIKTTGNGLDDILNAMAQFPEGARIEIAITWKDKSNGHVFVAEKKNGEVNFYDVQSGEKISQKVFEKVQSDETRFWRIDNLDPSDRGITACEAGE